MGRFFKRRGQATRRRSPLRTLESLEPRLVLDATVVFNEIMYNPPDDESLEWVELHNQMAVDMDLTGWSIRGIGYDFPEGTILGGGDYLVIAADPEALAAASGFADAIGPFPGSLSNGGEELELISNSDRRMNRVDYGDSGDWPDGPDGAGVSLAKIHRDINSEPATSWTTSAQIGGTPGAENFSGGLPEGDATLVINEVPSALDEAFWVEIANVGNSPSGAGYVLSRSGGDDLQHVLPSLQPGELLVLSEAQLGFDANSGNRLFLYTPNKAELADAQRVTDRLHGRSDEHDGRWLFPETETPGLANQFSFQDDIVINEIMFHPDQPAGEVEAEWIELYNRGNATVDLSLWELDGAVEFIFPAETEIASGGYLVIAHDAAGLAIERLGINVVGNFSGTLSNSGEQLSLLDALGNPADEVGYYDGGRWPSTADGTGPSIELRHPDVDNSLPEAWAASDEGSRTTWQTYTYRGVAQASRVGPDNQWREFVIGLLDSGEVLIDDISVIENPDTTNRQMLRNGSFETGTRDWRLLGNHRHAGVITDPLDPGNNVLRLTATGPTEHMHNHLETTLIDSIRNGRTYEISFRAKWISRSNQFHSRLYFNCLPKTTLIERPSLNGTPGAINSTAEPNIGPAYDGFIHSPAVPQPQQPVVVTVRAEDLDDIVSMRLWYSVNGGGWTSVGMSHLGDGLYSGSIPGRSASTVVQFYVEGQDRLGASSTFPAAGRDSRAMVKVDDRRAVSTGLHNIRLIVTPADRSFMHTDINLMSDDRIGTTLIYDEQEIFYDVGMRLKGSERGRTTSPRLGFNVKFNPDQLFRGVLGSMSLDRSRGVSFGQREILNDIMATHSASIPGEFNDLANIIAPLTTHTGGAIMQMARFSDVFLDEQFENGGDGDVFEYELIYYPTTTNGSGFKKPQPDRVAGTNIRSLGSDPEAYRWNYLKKNHRDEDDYSQWIAFTQVMGLTGSAFNNQIGDVIDVDQFLRAHAIATLTGMSDNYTLGAQHNAQFYIRPSDGRVLYFPHDMDAFPSTSRNITGGDWTKLLNVALRARAFYGHLHDIASTTWNRDHMQRWTEHFAQLLPGESWSSYLSDIGSRSANVLSQVNSRVRSIDFAITTGGGNDLQVDTPSVVLVGDGWINVREIRLAGSDQPLLVEWTDLNSWRVDVPLRFGENPLTLEAYDFQGELIATDSITVESTASDTRVADALRITEIMFNPAQLPGGAAFNNDDFEFIELKNISAEQISLEGVRFDNGVDFDFAGNLGPGEFTVVVQNRVAFLSRYIGFDQDLLIAGEYIPDNLRDSGERITLLDQFGQAVHNFTYGNGWYDGIEGDGFSLTVRDATADVSLWDVSEGWRPSSLIGGSPWADDSLQSPNPGEIVINEILTHSDTVGGDWIELHNTSDREINVGGWRVSDDPLVLDKFRIPFQTPAGTFIAPGGFLLLSEEEQFGNALHPGTSVPFGFSELGERIIVTAALADSTPLGFRVDKSFGAAANGVTFGRHVKSTGGSDFTAMAVPTPEADNSLPLVGPVVIHEIYYNPPEDRDEFDEFIELKNVSNAPVPLFDPAAPQNAWQFTGGITFTFPTGVNAVTMASGETILIVSNAPAAFRAANGVPAEIRIFGSHGTLLNNAGESLELSKPGPAELDGTVPLILVDRVNYNNVLPWPTEADGAGAALQRRVADAYGNDPGNWAASGDGGTPGIVPPQVTGVFVSVSDWTANFFEHLDAAGFAIRTGSGQFDALAWTGIDQVSIRFSRDMTVTQADLTLWGTGTRQFPVAGFTYDNANFIATWTLENPLRADTLLIDLSSDVHDVGGRGLDSDWVDGFSTFPSGNDFVEGDERFRFRINVLPGNVEAGPTVDRADLVDAIHHLGLDAGDAAYDPRHDLNGNAQTDLSDLRELLLRLHTRLPSGEPSPDTSSPPLMAVDTVFARLGAASPAPAAVADREPSSAVVSPRRSTADDSNLLGEISRRSRRRLATRRTEGSNDARLVSLSVDLAMSERDELPRTRRASSYAARRRNSAER